jgi:hypothetical protein
LLTALMYLPSQRRMSKLAAKASVANKRSIRLS